VAARVTDEAGQVHEDVVRIDYQPSGRTNGKAPETDLRSAPLYAAVARAMKPTGGEPTTRPPEDGLATDETGAELEVELIAGDVRLRAGEAGSVEVRLRNVARSEIRGEAQIVSPHETWPAITPWTQGFAVAPGKSTTVTFAVEPPFDFAGGTWWALVKVMYFGRLAYTESVPIEIAAATRVETPVPA
jgi:alpha-mannosidase